MLFVEEYFSNNQNYFHENRINTLKHDMLCLSHDELLKINKLQFRKPINMFFVSFILGIFGIDRFLLKEYWSGFFKFITFGGFYLWMIIDWFLIIKKTREYNYNILMNYLISNNSTSIEENKNSETTEGKLEKEIINNSQDSLKTIEHVDNRSINVLVNGSTWKIKNIKTGDKLSNN